MSASEDQRVKDVYEFGPFRVDPEKETLLRAGDPIPLTPKTFQILLVLVRHSKEVVTKDDLMKAVWPDTFVEEANLSRNICCGSKCPVSLALPFCTCTGTSPAGDCTSEIRVAGRCACANGLSAKQSAVKAMRIGLVGSVSNLAFNRAAKDGTAGMGT